MARLWLLPMVAIDVGEGSFIVRYDLTANTVVLSDFLRATDHTQGGLRVAFSFWCLNVTGQKVRAGSKPGKPRLTSGALVQQLLREGVTSAGCCD